MTLTGAVDGKWRACCLEDGQRRWEGKHHFRVRKWSSTGTIIFAGQLVVDPNCVAEDSANRNIAIPLELTKARNWF